MQVTHYDRIIIRAGLYGLYAAMRERFGLVISSMQSLWFRVADRIFGTEEVRTHLTAYKRKAVNFAASHRAAIAMEANPPIYHKNYINTAPRALRLIRETDSEGLLLNLDT